MRHGCHVTPGAQWFRCKTPTRFSVRRVVYEYNFINKYINIISEVEDKTDELTEIKNKLIRCNKSLRELMEIVKSTNEKTSKTPEEKENDKNRINNIFKKKQIGRPVEQYYDMVAKGKIKQPKQEHWTTTKARNTQIMGHTTSQDNFIL